MASQTDPFLDRKRSYIQALWRAARGNCPNCGSSALSWSPRPEGTRCHSCGTPWILARADRAGALALVLSTVLVLAISFIAGGLVGRGSPLVSGSFLGMAIVICAALFYRAVRRMLAVIAIQRRD